MKNATKFDVKCAVHGWQGDLSKVMFGVTHPWYGWVLAHISFINGYIPTDEAIALNTSRINQRLKEMQK